MKKNKINFRQRFEDQLDVFGEIIQRHKEINRYDLQKSLELSHNQFYQVQKDGLMKFSKTIAYDKKTKVYSYYPFVPIAKEYYSENEIERLCIMNPAFKAIYYEVVK